MMQKSRILIVDDDEACLEFAAACLNSVNYEVTTAHGGRQGFKNALASKPDLIVLDLLMPDMHGFDVCQALRKEKSLRNLKILIASAKGYASDHKAARKLGADEFLTKPFSGEQLLQAVCNLLGQQ